MAWKYIRANDTEARARRQATLNRIAGWWDALAAKLPEIEPHLEGGPGAPAAPDGAARALQLSSPALSGWMDEQLAGIDPRLRWEFGNDADGGRRLVVSPREHLPLRPMAHSLIARAPRVSGWTFYGYGPPLPALEAAEAVRLRTGHAVVAPTVLSRIGSHNRIDLVFKLKLARTDPAAAVGVAAALAEAALGEEAFDKWAGEVDAEELDRGPAPDQYLGLSQFRATAVGLSQTIAGRLPSQPWYAKPKPEKWRTIKSTPREEAADYARQDDLLIGRTVIPEARAAAFGEGPGQPPRYPFYSSNFSRHGETFCYLKFDAPGVSVDERRRRKYAFEDRIDPALRKAGAGCLVGSSTGTRYIYLDLAVTDLNQAMAALGPALTAAGGAPDRSWLLFYDTELADEYVGLHAASGPPPEGAAIEFPRRGAGGMAATPAPRVESPSESELFPDDLIS